MFVPVPREVYCVRHASCRHDRPSEIESVSWEVLLQWPMMPDIFDSSSLRLLFVIVVMVVVWRARSAGVIEERWWGTCLCHYVVGALASLCQ